LSNEQLKKYSRIFKDTGNYSRTTRPFSRIKDITRFDSKFRDSPWRSRTSGDLTLQTGKAADMSELQTHHCTIPGQWIWFFCTVGVIPAKKLSMQELNNFNRN